jgi:hypothetical protein
MVKNRCTSGASGRESRAAFEKSKKGFEFAQPETDACHLMPAAKMVLSQLAPLLFFVILATRANPATADHAHYSLHDALDPAGLEDRAAMANSLQSLGLSSLLEVQLLHAEEAQEMWWSLRERSISLGDRAKLRQAARGQSEQRVHSERLREEISPSTEPMVNDSKAGPGVAPIGMTSQRRLQEGVSSDSIALMVTAALGILSFVVQGRVAAGQAKDSADLDRMHVLREKEQAQASKLLERVQQQLSEFVVSAGTANVHSTRAVNVW